PSCTCPEPGWTNASTASYQRKPMTTTAAYRKKRCRLLRNSGNCVSPRYERWRSSPTAHAGGAPKEDPEDALRGGEQVAREPTGGHRTQSAGVIGPVDQSSGE